MKIILITYFLASIISFNSRSYAQGTEINKRNQLRRIYTAELGVVENTGRNDGPRVEEYLKYVNLKKGDPWCAAFVCWVFGKASVDNPRTGWSPALFPKNKLVWERSRAVGSGTVGREAVKGLPQRGDVFGIWFPDKGRIAHSGFVDHWDQKWLITVEGNTNEAGSREGDGVLRKRRLVKSIYKVASYMNNH